VTTVVKFLPKHFHQAQQVSAADEARMQRQSEARPLTKYERELEQLCKDYIKRKETKR